MQEALCNWSTLLRAVPGPVPACLSDLPSTSVSLFPFAEPKSAAISDLALRSRKRFADMAAKGPSQSAIAVAK